MEFKDQDETVTRISAEKGPAAGPLFADQSRQIARLRLALAARDQEIARRDQEIALKTLEIEGILHSSSWRVTAPLRFLTLKVRGILARMGMGRGASPLPASAPPVPGFSSSGPSSGEKMAQHWYDETTPEVSIIVLNWNKSQLTTACLNSLWLHTTGFRYEIIVVDNGSRAEEIRRLENFPGRYRLLRLPENLFFGEANNIGVEQARGEFIVFMNNDAFATPNWLPPLMDCLAQEKNAGAVGPKFIYPDGRLQEAGSVCSPNGQAYRLGDGLSPEAAFAQTIREVHYCSAACLLMRRGLFLQVRGFEWCWDPVYYEDTDLCLKIGLSGRAVYYCPASTIIHISNATTADPAGQLQVQRIFGINRARFARRWSAYLEDGSGGPEDLIAPAPPAWPAADTKPTRIGLYCPGRLAATGQSRLLLTLAQVLAAEETITIITRLPCSRTRLLTVARDLGLSLASDHIRIVSGEDAASSRFDLFIALSESVLPPVPGLGRRNLLVCPTPNLAPETGGDAAAWWDGYETLVVHSPADQTRADAAIQALGLTAKPVRIIPPPAGRIEAGADRSSKRETAILHVGRFEEASPDGAGHETAIAAFRRLAGDFPGVRLYLAGHLPPEARHQRWFQQLQDQCSGLTPGLTIEFHANASREELLALYRRAMVYWHMVPGETAILEAMFCGCVPVISGKAGPLPFLEHGRSGFQVETEEELIHLSHRILTEPGTSWMEEARQAASDTTCTRERSFAAGWWSLCDGSA